MDVKKVSEVLTIAMWLVGGILLFSTLANAAPDPNFHIYIAYGQSNMAGAGDIRDGVDNVEHPRFKMFATTKCVGTFRPTGLSQATLNRSTVGEIYPAIPPMFHCNEGLSVSDWFGRAMADALPNVTVGIIPVAVGGTKIELFDKDKYAQYLNSLPLPNDQYLINWAKDYGSDGNAHARIVEVAKKAQEVGVIKGIIFHQGESGAMSGNNWQSEVKKTRDDILEALGLTADEVPFLAGGLEEQDAGGCCWSFSRNNIKTLPNVMENTYFVSSDGLSGNGKDPYHFSSASYQEFGKRYAEEMLKHITVDVGPLTPQEPYNGKAVELPGIIEAENFDKPGTGAANKSYSDNDSENQGDAKFRTEDGVDIVEGGSGKAIGYTNAGEWLEYTINVKTAGKYKLTLNTASGSTTSSLQFSVDGTNITDEISIPQTAENKWDVYQEVDAGEVELKAGEQIIRLTITGSYVNVDWFKFEAIGSNGEVIEIIDPPSSSSGATTTPGSSASKGSNDSKKEEAPEAIYAGNMHMGISTSSTYNVFDLKGQRLARFTARNMAEATQMWKNASMSASKIQGIVLIRNQHSGETVQVKSIR